MLQKLVEVDYCQDGSGFLHQAEGLGNKAILGDDVSPLRPSELTLADHVHDFVAFQRSPCRVKEAESQTGLHQPFNESVILLNDVVQILARTQCAGLGKNTFLTQDIKGAGIGGIAVNVDHPRR